MIIGFRDSDRLLGAQALAIYEKGLDAAVSACEKVFQPTLALDAEKAKAEAAADWLYASLDEMGLGEIRELDMPADLALPLRIATSVYLAQLSKLEAKQVDLLVPIEDTQAVVSQVTNLCDRLRGQLDFLTTLDARVAEDEPGTATVSVNGGPEMPFNTPSERQAAVDVIADQVLR